MDKLRDYLRNLPVGKVENPGPVERLLSEYWATLEGYSGSGMEGYKVLGRTENMEWDPPFLTFTIERHGGLVQGSSRAELQHWSVNVETGTASYSQGIRQKNPRAQAIKTKPLAEKIGKLIIEKQDCLELKWDQDKTSVCIIAKEVIPEGMYKQTMAGRRKRFRRDLTEFLKNSGWQEVRPNNYRFGAQQ